MNHCNGQCSMSFWEVCHHLKTFSYLYQSYSPRLKTIFPSDSSVQSFYILLTFFYLFFSFLIPLITHSCQLSLLNQDDGLSILSVCFTQQEIWAPSWSSREEWTGQQSDRRVYPWTSTRWCHIYPGFPLSKSSFHCYRCHEMFLGKLLGF